MEINYARKNLTKTDEILDSCYLFANPLTANKEYISGFINCFPSFLKFDKINKQSF